MSRVFFTFILLIDPYRPYSVGMKKCPLPDNPWDWLRPLSWPCTLYKCINSVLVKSQFLGCASNKNLPQTTDSETLSSSIYHSRVCRILDERSVDGAPSCISTVSSRWHPRNKHQTAYWRTGVCLVLCMSYINSVRVLLSVGLCSRPHSDSDFSFTSSSLH